MKKFMLLHVGFEKPTPEVMKAWGAWMGAIADRTVDQNGLGSAREISRAGTKELPWGMESITGYNRSPPQLQWSTSRCEGRVHAAPFQIEDVTVRAISRLAPLQMCQGLAARGAFESLGRRSSESSNPLRR